MRSLTPLDDKKISPILRQLPVISVTSQLFQLDPGKKHGAAMVVDPVQSTDRRLQDGLAMATSCALVAADSRTSASGLAVFLFVLGA